jgi:DUF4097 and DUF4098 domain-containing protein YvlB
MTTKTFPLTGPINLLGRIGRGSFTVTAQDDITEATVTLTARTKGADIVERSVVELRGPTLVVTTPRQGGIFDLTMFGGRGEREAIDVAVTVPSGTAMKISTFTADVTVTGRSGSADIASGSSTIELEHVDGDLRLRYGSGVARVGRVSGSVEARSGSGHAHFGEIAGSLTSACGSGDLEVAAVRGRVRTRAGSGGASLGAVYGDVDLASGSGGLTIGLPAGTRARLDVTTGSGRVDSELRVDDAPRGKGKAINVRARTGSGDVRLVRPA